MTEETQDETQPTTSRQREIAKTISLQGFATARYVKEEGWTPNYILTTSNIKASRLNIMGVIVEKSAAPNGSFSSVTIDDGTAKISIREFQDSNLLTDADIGDVIGVIGKPREYGSERYILPESVTKISNPKWVEVRKLELKLNSLKSPESTVETNSINEQQTTGEKIENIQPSSKIEEPAQTTPTISEESVIDDSSSEKIESEEEVKIENIEVIKEDQPISIQEQTINLINEKDSGDGADIQEIIDTLNNPKTENIINRLLKEGEIFEVRAGKIKILE